MDNIILLTTMMASFLALTVIYAAIPYISKKTLSFGVAIPEKEFNETGITAIRQRYRNLILLAGVLFMALIVYLASSDLSNNTLSSLLGVLVFINIAVNGIIYFWAHKKTSRLKSASSWSKNTQNLVTVNTSFKRDMAMINPMWFIIYIVIIAATVVISLMLYDTLPDQLPTRYNAAGQIITYTAKTYGAILYMPLIQLFMVLISVFAYYSIVNSKLQIDPANREQTYQQNILFRKRWSGYAFVLGLIVLLMFTGVQFAILGLIPHPTIIVVSVLLTVVIIAGTITLAITTGQSGSRIKVGHDNDSPSETIAKDDDSYWKWGVFYYNPQDPSLFVEKRFGIGWTFNFGRRVSWIILFGILGLTGIIILASTLMLM